MPPLGQPLTSIPQPLGAGLGAIADPGRSRPIPGDLEEPEMSQSGSLENEGAEHPEDLHPVDDAVFEADARCLGEVSHRHGGIAEIEAVVGGLREQLGVESEVLGVALEVDRLEHLATVGTESRVAFSQILPEHHVHDQGEAPVHQVLVERHPALQGLAAGADACAQHDVADAVAQEADEIGDQAGVVLVVGVEHHHDVRTALERGPVTRLLVAPVAPVACVSNYVNAKRFGHAYRVVWRTIID